VYKRQISVLNEGLACAKGDYIARMDGDDVACPERFAKQVTFLQQHPDYVAVGSQVQLIDADGDKICSFADLDKHGQSNFTEHEAIDQAHLRGRGGTICHPAVMLRREAVLEIGGYSPHAKHAEDLDLFLRLGEVGRLSNLPDVLLLYRMHHQSIGHLKRQEQRESARVAVMEACQRRGLPQPEAIATGGDHQDTLSALHQKWVWWALKGGNIQTARKHARIAVRHSPLSVNAWKTLWCTVRGS
ncbi:MAG: glycosyltransferase, partial [Leptolyngbyaceae cyanobacterium]